jgi:hypothetical protein
MSNSRRWFLGLLFALCGPFLTPAQGQTFELFCPAGSQSISNLQTFDNATGKYRQNYWNNTLALTAASTYDIDYICIPR